LATHLANKIVWLTGASSGIGEALAKTLAARDASLVLTSRREDMLRNVCTSCAHPEQHFVLPLDLLAAETFPAAVHNVIDRFGRIDVLIHCAGISQRGTGIETELKVDRHLMELNYFGPVALTKQVLPSMLARGAGHIAAISSLLGKFGLPNRAAYSASKHALHGFFDSLRAEVENQGIAVTLVCPGFVRTNASFNALEGDGTPHNQMDAEIAHGLPADVAARRIVQAIERRRREVYICRQEILGLYLSRFAPGIFHWATKSKQK
jgi:dehydrogenase/reductase SDR family member 7B